MTSSGLTRRGLIAAASALACPALVRPARAAGGTLNVSAVLRPFNVPQIVMRERRLLEKRLEPLGMTVTWHDITSGVVQAQALASGALDIASVINPISLVLALANHNPMKIVAGFARNTKLAAILSLNPAIRTAADLKGRTVAGIKGTVLHELLIKALQQAGLGIDDVTFLDMDLPASYTALLARRVDAAVLAADLILKADHAGAHELEVPPRIVTPVNTVCASDALIARQPQLVRLFKEAQREAVALVAADPEAAIALGCRVNGIAPADGRTLFGWQSFFTDLTEADLDSIGRDMQFLLDVGLCPRPVDLRAATFEALAT